MKKTFSLRAGIALLAIVALQGCYLNPHVRGAGSIQEFARDLSGKRYDFVIPNSQAPLQLPNRSAKPVTAQDIPQGLMVALEPAQALCTKDGGQPSFSDLREADGTRGKLPQRLVCQRGIEPLWALFITYTDVGTNRSYGGTLTMTVHARVPTAEQYAVQLQEEKAKEQAQTEAREKAAAAQRERQAAFERDRPQREAQARQAALEESARVGRFQANLKAGDRFQWVRAPGAGHPIVGMVVRVEGALAFVQFDNLTIAGQQTRYLPKAELEPFDGPTPSFRRSID